VELFCFDGGQIETRGHSAVETEDDFHAFGTRGTIGAQAKTSPERRQKALKRGRIAPVTPENLNVNRNALLVCRYRQEHLMAISAMIPAVPVARQPLRSLALEVDTRQIVEYQADGPGAGLGEETPLDRDPLPGQQIHRPVEIILIEGLLALIQPAGPGQQGPARLRGEGTFRGREEKPPKDERTQEATLP